MLDFAGLLKKKKLEAIAAENQVVDEMPHAHISIQPMNAVKSFFEDREYDDVPFKLDGPANMKSVQDILRKEQGDEYMHRDENIQTFNIINETKNPHPYDAYFQRKRPDEQSN